MYGHTDIHDEQRSGQPSGSAKIIANVKQEMLENWHVTVRELCKRIPEPVHVAGEFYGKGMRKMPQCLQKCIDRNTDYIKITESPAFPSM